jgi:hypothetical protein
MGIFLAKGMSERLIAKVMARFWVLTRIGDNKMSPRKLISVMTLLGAGVIGSNAAFAGCPTPITLPTASATNSVTFGNAISYSLPILGLTVQSSPGHIDDCIVVATGASGTNLLSNESPVIDDAYHTPSGTGGQPWFQTGFSNTGTPFDPGSNGGPPGVTFTGDQPNTWDIQLSALHSFLNGNDMVVYFNHNQTNSGTTIDQDLFVWAQIAVADTTGVLPTLYFYLTSVPNNSGIQNFGQPGGDPSAYVGPQTPATCTYPSGTDAGCTFPHGGIGTGTGSGDASFMVRAIGQVCLNGPVGVGTPVPCSGPHVAVVNENLGANDVSNAVLFPQINAILDTPGFLGYNVIHADIRLGCNPATITTGDPTSPTAPCPNGAEENNGYEQIFIGQLSRTPGPPGGGIPEPATLALVGVALLGGGFVRHRRRQS